MHRKVKSKATKEVKKSFSDEGLDRAAMSRDTRVAPAPNEQSSSRPSTDDCDCDSCGKVVTGCCACLYKCAQVVAECLSAIGDQMSQAQIWENENDNNNANYAYY